MRMKHAAGRKGFKSSNLHVTTPCGTTRLAVRSDTRARICVCWILGLTTMPLIAGPFEPDKGQGAPPPAEVVVGRDQSRFLVIEPTEGPKRYVRVLPGGHGRTYVELANGAFVESVNREIHDSLEAAALVEDARHVDPMFCPRDQADRDKAALLYERAIAAQPAAKINAALADRVAQLYAFYEDKQKEVKPVPGTARQWWNRCAESTSPKQFLWAQAQMGLASTAVVGRDYLGALAAYDRILQLDPETIELADWKAWPDGGSDRDKAVLEEERSRLRQAVEGIQARAAEKQFYVLNRVDKVAGVYALGRIAAKYKGTPAGDRAAKMLGEIAKATGKDPLALPDFTPAGEGEPGQRATAAEGPPRQEPPWQEPAPAPAPTGASDGRNARGWEVAAFVTLGAAAMAVGILWTRRRNRVPS